MPIIREPRTAEARAHQTRIAAVLESVAQKFGLQGSEVYSPEFLDQHLPGDRWFCTICFGPMICAPDGHPLASNNGVERDGETKRLTVHCADKNCKKRQCKAVRLSCKTTLMNDLILTRIRTQMQETSANMEKSLGILYQGRKSSKGKGSKDTPKGKNGKSWDGAKGKGKGERPRLPEISKSVFSGFNDVLKAKGQPSYVRSADRVALKVKEPSAAAKEATDMLLDVSDRIPFAGVGCSSIKMWNTFDRKTRMCRTVQELIEQAKWLVGQFKPTIFKSRWLTGAQVDWIEDCARAEDFKHCKVLIQRLETEALNWDAIELMWNSDDKLDAEHKGLRSFPNQVSRRSASLGKSPVERERWSSQEPVHISGWSHPKKITFVLGAHGDQEAPEGSRGSEARSYGMNSLFAQSEAVGRERVADPTSWQAGGQLVPPPRDEDFSEGDEDDSASLDDSPSPWDNLDEDDGVPGVKHDRGFMDAGKFDSPAVIDVRKSPFCSPMVQPPGMDKAVLGMEPLHATPNFGGRAAGFDGQDVSSMSTDDDYGDDSGWRAPDFRVDLGLGLTDSRNGLTEIGPLTPSNLVFASTSLTFLELSLPRAQ